MTISHESCWLSLASQCHVLLLSQQITPVYKQWGICPCCMLTGALQKQRALPEPEDCVSLWPTAIFSVSAFRCSAEPCNLADVLDGCFRCGSLVALDNFCFLVFGCCVIFGGLHVCKLMTFCWTSNWSSLAALLLILAKRCGRPDCFSA